MLDNFVVELYAVPELHKVIFLGGERQIDEKNFKNDSYDGMVNGIKRLTRFFHFAQFTLVVCQLCKKESWVGKF